MLLGARMHEGQHSDLAEMKSLAAGKCLPGCVLDSCHKTGPRACALQLRMPCLQHLSLPLPTSASPAACTAASLPGEATHDPHLELLLQVSDDEVA